MDIQVYTLNNQVFLQCSILPCYSHTNSYGLHLVGPSVASWWDSGCGQVLKGTDRNPPGCRLRRGGRKFGWMSGRREGRCPDEWWCYTVDGSEILLYPIMKTRFLYISGGWVWDFWTIDCIFWFISPRVAISFGFISSSSKWKIYRLPLFSEGPVSCILYHLILWTSSTLMMVLQLRIEVAEDTNHHQKFHVT